MSVLKALLKAITGLVILLILAAVFLPSRFQMERSISISASPEVVFPYVADLRLFNRWSPWAKLDPETKYTFSGPVAGEGSSMSWYSTSPEVGSGSLTITDSVLNQRVDTALDFGDQGQGKASRLLASEPGNNTRVTWQFSTDFGWNLVGRYMGLLFDSMLGPAYEEGLANLKHVVENSKE